MRQIRLFKDVMSYLGIDEERINEYIDESFAFANEDEIEKLDDIEIGNMVAHMIESDINLYFDSGRNYKME